MRKSIASEVVSQHTWVTVAYSLGHKFAKCLKMTPEKVIGKLWKVCKLPSPHVCQPFVEVRHQQHAGRYQENLKHAAVCSSCHPLCPGLPRGLSSSANFA